MIIDVMDLELETINLNRSYDNGRNFKAKRIYSNGEVEVEIVEKLEDKQGDVYKITAKVEGNYDTYTVKLKLQNSMLKECSCTCPDNDKGNLCKHTLATCMETIEPHYASTNEGRKKLFELKRKEQEEIIKELKRKQEEERKKLEYKRKYSRSFKLYRNI